MAEKSLNISYEQMRFLVIETLRRGGVGQFAEVNQAVALSARNHGLVDEPGFMGGGRHEDRLPSTDAATVQSIMWDLLIEGVIRPGLNDGVNNSLPFFHVTERGKVVLKDGPEAPYDPDGYLARLQRDVPAIDPGHHHVPKRKPPHVPHQLSAVIDNRARLRVGKGDAATDRGLRQLAQTGSGKGQIHEGNGRKNDQDSV